MPSMSDHPGVGRSPHPPVTLTPPGPNFKVAQQSTQTELANDGAFVTNYELYFPLAMDWYSRLGRNVAALEVDTLRLWFVPYFPCHLFCSSFELAFPGTQDLHLLLFVSIAEYGLSCHIYHLVSHFRSSCDPHCIDQPERFSKCPIPEH
jgi:hypothetical protein